MVSLYCLGACEEVGRSNFLLKTDKNIMLDYGVKIFTQEKKPKYPMEVPEYVDAAVISHAHLDHSGFVPHLYTKGTTPWFATPPTRDLCEILFQDSMKIMGKELPYGVSHFNKAMKHWHPLFYDKKTRFGETEIIPRDAGHVLGASILEIKHNRKKIVYSGDFKIGETKLHKGAEFVEDVDTLIMESTYGVREHPDRKELEKQMMEEVKETLDQGGNVLFPAFALGRSQEVVSILRAHDQGIPIYLDGMSKAMSQIYLKYPYYLRDFEEFEDAITSINFVNSSYIRKEATREPSVIVSTAGMMEGGPALSYLMHLNPNSKIILTGFAVEGTNSWRLMNTGKIKKDEYELDVELPVEYLDFSAHASHSELLEFVKKANPKKIVLVHGDKETMHALQKELKEKGYDAVIPKFGEKLEI